jgi:hypothetical protein
MCTEFSQGTGYSLQQNNTMQCKEFDSDQNERLSSTLACFQESTVEVINALIQLHLLILRHAASA